MSLVRLYKYFTDSRDEVDQKMGMTEKQKKIVQNTWANVRKYEVTYGVTIMFALFARHPEYQNEFRLFKGMTNAELEGNKRFHAHSASIIRALSGAIDYVHDSELMEANLLTLAERHKERGQTRQHFENLKVVLEELLPSVFGKQYTPEVQEAWKKMLDYMFSIFCRAYND